MKLYFIQQISTGKLLYYAWPKKIGFHGPKEKWFCPKIYSTLPSAKQSFTSLYKYLQHAGDVHKINCLDIQIVEASIEFPTKLTAVFQMPIPELEILGACNVKHQTTEE